LKILLIEDDEAIADAIVKSIIRSEMRIDHVACLADAKAALHSLEVGLIILDLGLPDGDGLRFLKSMRRDGYQHPVLILTARDRVNDRVNGLNEGADDYLAKPFDMVELIARLRALGRRQAGRSSNVIEYERLELLPDHQTVRIDGKVVNLPVSQFRLLQYLLEEQGRVKTKHQIIDALYSWDTDVEENTIEVYISQLRKSLWKDIIRTVRGIGYSIPALTQSQ
jgi:two-component system response regulator QseB